MVTIAIQGSAASKSQISRNLAISSFALRRNLAISSFTLRLPGFSRNMYVDSVGFRVPRSRHFTEIPIRRFNGATAKMSIATPRQGNTRGHPLRESSKRMSASPYSPDSAACINPWPYLTVPIRAEHSSLMERTQRIGSSHGQCSSAVLPAGLSRNRVP